MACDDESGGGTSRILWYEVGRSEGAASMRRNQEIQEARHWNAGVRTINLKDYQVLVANRDQLWREAHHYHHELQLANQEIAKANSHIRQLSREIETQESTNTLLSESASTANTRRLEAINFYGGVDDCLRALLKAAEDGKTHYPEYQELKTIVQQMRDEWAHHKTRLYRHDRLGPHIVDLMQALQR
jgi:ethanolamine utilization protein EutA (predicted chaperonin)